LGSIPLDPQVAGGRPVLLSAPDSAAARAITEVADYIAAALP